MKLLFQSCILCIQVILVWYYSDIWENLFFNRLLYHWKQRSPTKWITFQSRFHRTIGNRCWRAWLYTLYLKKTKKNTLKNSVTVLESHKPFSSPSAIFPPSSCHQQPALSKAREKRSLFHISRTRHRPEWVTSLKWSLSLTPFTCLHSCCFYPSCSCHL